MSESKLIFCMLVFHWLDKLACLMVMAFVTKSTLEKLHHEFVSITFVWTSRQEICSHVILC